jgi:hypothetical protein
MLLAEAAAGVPSVGANSGDGRAHFTTGSSTKLACVAVW